LISSLISSSDGSVSSGPSQRFEPHGAHFEAAQRLLQRFLEIAPDGHDLADGLHLRGQTRIGLAEFSKAKRGTLVTT
jgi:hypothetical protein